MNPSRRLVRLACLFLGLMVVTFLGTSLWDLSTHARIQAVAREAVLRAPAEGTADQYRAFLDGLPRPSGWISYSIEARDPTTWTRRLIARVSNPAWEQPIAHLLDNFGVLDSSWVFGMPLVDSERTHYQLAYTRVMPGPIVFFAIIGFGLAFWVTLALWLYQDAKGRLGSKALPWLGLGLIGGPVAIAIWLIQRPAPPPPPPVCPACKTEQVEEATYCVDCGAHLKPTCGECGRAIEQGWKHCPTCGNHLDQESA